MERDMFLAGDNACGGGGSGARQDENTALFKRRKRRGSPFSLHQSAVGTSTGSSMTLKELLYRELFFLNQQHNSLLEREEIVDATLARLRILEMGEEGQEEGEYQGSPITVVVNNANGEKMSARIKKNTQLKSLLQTYCDREVVRMDRTRFVFRGKTIQPEQTVDELRMKDGSVIDVDALPHHLYPIPPNFDVRELLFSEQVLLQQQLACLLRRAKQVETWLQEVTLKEAGFDTGISHQDQTHRIRIKLTCSGRDDDEMFFDIEKDTQMGRMMQVVYDILGADEEHLAFLFNNQNITAEETPDEIGLEDGDAIAAFITCCPRSCSYRVDGNCQRWKKIKEVRFKRIDASI